MSRNTNQSQNQTGTQKFRMNFDDQPIVDGSTTMRYFPFLNTNVI